MRARCEAAEGHLQHLQSASDSVLAELERTRQAVTSSAQSHVLEVAAGRLVSGNNLDEMALDCR